MTLLQIENIEAGYGAHLVLRGLSLTLAQGQMAALIGPNGHGKTTLLRCISGLVRLRAGSIRFDGRRIDGLRPDEVVAAGIVHVPQGDMLFPEMTVLENLMMGAYLPQAARTGRPICNTNQPGKAPVLAWRKFAQPLGLHQKSATRP